MSEFKIGDMVWHFDGEFFYHLEVMDVSPRSWIFLRTNNTLRRPVRLRKRQIARSKEAAVDVYVQALQECIDRARGILREENNVTVDSLVCNERIGCNNASRGRGSNFTCEGCV